MKTVTVTLIIALFLASCSTKPVTKKYRQKKKYKTVTVIPAVKEYTSVSKSFLQQCEGDTKASADVIAKKHLIGTLSHFNLMDRGGRKYYLLEKQNISSMLNKLSSNPYTECYLVDKNGKIVYAMFNEKIVGKKIRHYKTSPLYTMFKRGVNGKSTIRDVTTYPIFSGSHDVYFSEPVYRSDINELEGVLITAVHIKNLGKKLPHDSKIVGRDGLYRYHSELEKIYGNDEVFSSEEVEEKTDKKIRKHYSDGYYIYQPVSYKNINWVLVIKEPVRRTKRVVIK